MVPYYTCNFISSLTEPAKATKVAHTNNAAKAGSPFSPKYGAIDAVTAPIIKYPNAFMLFAPHSKFNFSHFIHPQKVTLTWDKPHWGL